MKRPEIRIIILSTIAIIICTALILTQRPKPKVEFVVFSPQQLGEIYCMAHAVYHEARGEPIAGQIAVAYVVKNRMKDKKYPNDACATVYQAKQFTDIKSTNPDVDSQAWDLAVKNAQKAYFGIVPDPTKGAKYYYAPKKVKTPKWAKYKQYAINIGNHKFFNLSKE